MQAGAQTGRPGNLPGLQPTFMVERARLPDEGGSRARGRPGPAQVLERRVPPAVVGVQESADRARAVSGQITAARRVERSAVQHLLRGRVQCASAAAGPEVRLAFACVLHQMIRFSKAHAYGNDFLYVREDAVTGVAVDRLARAMCDRHSGVGADGLMLYRPTPAGAAMELLNADGSPSEVSG